MNILIVDDSRAMRMLLKRSIRQAGCGDHEFWEATNGKEALATIKGQKPDLILCDWNMPEMTGIELLEALNVRESKIPFGFVTSEGTAEMRERATQSGAWFLVTKPFTPDTLGKALRSVMSVTQTSA